MKKLVLALAAAAILLSCSQRHYSPAQPGEMSARTFMERPDGFHGRYTLEEVVVLSRHNIRSPLSGKGSVLSRITPHEWFEWTSAPGELSRKGAILETQMGQFFREKYGYTHYYGDPVEFHESGMVTFGLLGTKAPKEEKLNFDPDKLKRRAIYKEVCDSFSNHSVFIGGSTSFDITPKQYNKYDAIMKYAAENGYSKDEIIFIGDDLEEGGNDSHVRLGGLDYIYVHDYRDFPELIKPLLSRP